MSKSIRWTLFVIVGVLALAVGGCSLFGTSTNTKDTGVLTLSLTDAPANDLAQVNVTITEVQVLLNGNWQVLNRFPEGYSVNLLELRFDEALLGSATLPAGAYSQIRLIVDDSSIAVSNVIDVDGNTSFLKVPSGEQTGLKIHHDFVVPGGGTVALIMDVNVLDFVHRKGTGIYQMVPTAIRVVDSLQSGTLTGSVVDATGAPITTTDVYVTLFWDSDGDGTPDDYNGDGVFDEAVDYAAQTLALREDFNGRLAGDFQLNAVPVPPSGSYIIRVTAEGYEPGEQGGIVVTSGENTEVDGDPATEGMQPITLTTAISTP